MSEKPSSCVKCGGPLQRARTGRPPLYCGAVCRQAAAYEIKRLQQRLLGLETRLSDLQTLGDDGYFRDYRGRKPGEQRAALLDEIAAAERRLLLLLSEPRGKSPLPFDKGEPS